MEEQRQIQPLFDDILVVIVPHDFRVPVIESYDGTGDPNEHLAAFDLQMIISNGSDAQKDDFGMVHRFTNEVYPEF